eukprot:TRINITY_DN1427_c0_g2_i1.p1 TRINITY_DN1427_c0_g2~~TRINITY_DN1427_c0_g2_i1.p1  ORF type:complete len:200 (+),score=32.28 TRINITY_DN1427_c0_g2_i1:424-1023(+)
MRLMEALWMYGRRWKLIQAHVGTRSAAQACSHAQKFLCKSRRIYTELSAVQARVGTSSISPPLQTRWQKAAESFWEEKETQTGGAREKKNKVVEVCGECLDNEQKELEVHEEEENHEMAETDSAIIFPEEVEYDVHMHLSWEDKLDIPNFQTCLATSFKDKAECASKENVDDREIPIRLSYRLSSLFEYWFHGGIEVGK